MQDDWRLDIPHPHLRGQTLVKAALGACPGWDHEHCELCFDKLTGNGAVWYRTGTPPKQWWICPVCFEDFREHFGWTESEQ